jgi:hypothetical protein
MGARNREGREGWPLLTFETEVNGGSKNSNERDPFLVVLFEPVIPIQEIFVLPWLL